MGKGKPPRLLRLGRVGDLPLQQHADKDSRQDGGERGLQYGFHESERTHYSSEALQGYSSCRSEFRPSCPTLLQSCRTPS